MEEEMKYVIDILKDRLREERIAKGQADEYLRGSGFSTKNKDDIKAFEESRRIAQERIPQLQSALKHLESNPLT